MNAVTSITAAKMKALREAKKLGCSGAHQTDDGIWRPCSSAEALAKIIPSSPSGASGSIGPRRQQRGNNNMRRQWEPLGARGVVSIDTLAGGGLVSGVVGKQYQPAAPRDEDPDVFTDIEVARDRSRQLGCIGVSRRTSRSGRTVWMPCTNMSDLANRTGRTSLGRRNMQKRTERFIADVVRRNQPKATRSRKKSLYDDLHGNGGINTKGLGPKVGRRIGRGLRAAPAGFVFIDITGAIDADKDGIVFEGLPLERPIIPRFIIPEGTARRVQNLIGTTAQANEQNRRNGLSVDGAIDKTVLSQIIGTTPNDVPDKREDPLLSKLRNVLGPRKKPSTYAQSAVMEDERTEFGDPDLEISRASARLGKREAAGFMKALDAVDDEYEYFTTGELSELVTQLVPGSNEELMDALKSSPYTKKNAKQIYKRIAEAEPDYEATLLVRKILQDELFKNAGVRNAIRRYGIPPIVVTGYEPDISNMGFIDITSGPRLWQSIIGGYAPNGFIAFNSGVFPDPDTGRIRDSLFRDEDLDSLVRHELAHAWQFMAAKQGGPARDYLVSLYSELQENLQQGRGNAASQNYSEALYRSVTWGSEEERASARRISNYAETARIEWFAESFAAFTDDDPSRRVRVDNTSIKNMADVWGMSVNEFLTFVGERNQDQLSERARSSSTRSVSNLLLGEMSKPEKEAHDWLLNNPNYIADAPDAMLLRLPPDTLDNFIRNQRMSTRSRYNTDISKAQAKAEEARRNGELGQRVLDALFDRATGENSSSRPTMWFVGGTTGSGKSTLRGNGVLTGVPDIDTAVDIDPDVIKSMHPDWDNGRGASAVHGWSTQWALYGMRQATAQNRDYVVTGTGVRVDQMLIGKDNGYRIIGHYVHVPTDIAEKRMASRGKQGGVQLPSYLASQYAAELQWKVRKAITNGYMNEFHLWDNSQDENNATLAAIRREDGTFEIFNRKVFNEFFGKEGALAVEKHWESQRAETTTGSVLASVRSSSQHSGFSTRSSRNRNLPEKLILESAPNRRKTLYRKDLRGKRTANSELSHMILGGDVDLSDSDWNSTYFYNVTAENLKTSQPLNFNNARLQAVSLKNTIIPPESNFNRATLERVAFDGSDIFNVDFSETSLRGVDFSKTKVGNINLRGAILERVEFDVADLSNSGLTIEDLRGSGIIWTDRTKFSPEIQQFIDSLPSGQVINKNGKYSFKVNNESTTPINKADRDYASIRQARLGRRKIEVPTLESDGQAISGMDGTGGRISDADWKRLAGKRITSSYMGRLSAINQDVVDVKITHSWMDNALFTNSTLQDVSLAGSILQRAVFRGADIRGVLNLRGTDLQLADFNGAKVDVDVLRIGTIDLREADLTEAKLGNLPLGRLKLDNAILKGAVWNGPTSMIPKDLRDRGLTGTRSMSRQTSYGAAIQINDLSDRLSNATRLSNREKTELVQDISSMYRELLDSKIQRPERQEFADFIESLKDASSKDLDRFRVPTMNKRPMLLIESARANNKQSFVERFKKVRENEPEFMKGLSVIQAWKQASAAADKTDELENLHMQALDELREERAVAQSLPQLQNILHGDFLDADNRKRPTGKLPSGKRAKETIIADTESTRSRRIEADKPLPLSEISPDLSDKFPATNTQSGGVTTIALAPERRRISERLSRLLRRSYSRIKNDGRENYLPAATKDILEDVLRDDLTKLQDGTFLRMSARESLKDDKERLLNSLRIIFDTREGTEAVNLPTMHAEPYEPFRSMVDPEIDWSSIYIPTDQDTEDLLREISTLKIDGYDLGTEIRLNLQQWQKINREHQGRFRTNDELPLDEDESFDETFLSIYEEGMRSPSRFGTMHDAMHLAVGRGFDRHGEYAAILAEISFILQIPELPEEMRNVVASGTLRQILGVPFGEAVKEIIPDIENSVFDMPKVFDAMIRKSTYKGVGGNDSRISTRSMRDASDADIDAITQEYLGSKRFSRRLSEVYGIDAPRSLRSTRSTALDELSDEEIRALATRKGLTERDLQDIYQTLVNARDFIRRNKGESFSYAPGLGEENARRMRDSIRVEMAPNGVPMVMAEPFEAVIDEVPDKRDWSKVLAPSIKDIERLVDAIRKARDSDSPILEELSEESRDRVTKAAYYVGEPESPFDKIISQIFEKLGSTEYRGTPTGAYDSWVGIYLEGLANPKRMQAGLGSDGIHDFFGHFGVGRGFDRHGEWAAALVTDSLIRDHPAFDFLTPDERESLRREFFTGGAGGAQRLRQQLETEYEQRFGIPMDFATQRYDVPSGRFVDVVDTRTPEERDTAEVFKEIGQITYGELAAMYDRDRRQYFSMDEILDLLGVSPATTRPEARSNSRTLMSTRSSRSSTPFAEASNDLLLSIAGNEAAIKKERSMRSTRSGRREMTDSEKQRLKPVSMEVNEKKKFQPGTTLVYTNRDDQVIRTELVGPQVLRIRGVEGVNVYIDPTPDNQDEVDARMRQWEIDYGPVSSPSRQAQNTGGQAKRDLRERDRPQKTVDEDSVDRMLREIEENKRTRERPFMSSRSVQSSRSTRLISSTTPQLRISEDGSRTYMDASAKEAFLRDPKRVLDGLTEADIPEGYFPKGQRNKLEQYKQDLLALATLDSLVPNTEGYGVSARNLFAIDVLDTSKPNPPMDIQRGIRRGILGTRRTEKIFHQADVVSLKVDEALFVTDIPATSKMSAIDNAIIFRNTDGSLSLIEIENADELDVIEGLMDEAKQRVNENGVGIFMLNDITPSSPASTVSPVVKVLENYHTTIADIDPRIPRPNIIFKADFFAQQIPGFDPKQVAGTAYPDNNSIVLWRTSEELPSVDIMLHEFGHSVDFTLGHRVVRGGDDISYSSNYNFSSVTDDWEPAMESDQAHGLLFGAQNIPIAVLANTGQAKQPTSVPGTTYRNIAPEVDIIHGPRIGDKFITQYAGDTDQYVEDFAESASLFLRDKMFGYSTSLTSPSGEVREYTFAEMYPNRAAVLEKLLYPSTRSASKFDARFKSAYGADPIYGDGDCYEAASSMASRLRGEEFGFSDDQIRIVHGVPLGTGGDATGIRYGHAWTEVAKNGWDKYEQLRNEIAEVLREAETLTSQSLKNSLAARHNKLMMELVRMELEDVTVYDFSNGNEHIIPKYLYYKIGNIEDENTRYYSRRDADIKMQADETYGPWE